MRDERRDLVRMGEQEDQVQRCPERQGSEQVREHRARSGIQAELRKREAYEKPSVKRKKKSEAARKRKYK